MKLATQIFIIIGMVVGAIGIVPIVLGIFALKHLNEAKKAEDITILWKLLTFFFVSPIASILMFCIKDEHLVEAAK